MLVVASWQGNDELENMELQKACIAYACRDAEKQRLPLC